VRHRAEAAADVELETALFLAVGFAPDGGRPGVSG